MHVFPLESLLPGGVFRHLHAHVVVVPIQVTVEDVPIGRVLVLSEKCLYHPFTVGFSCLAETPAGTHRLAEAIHPTGRGMPKMAVDRGEGQLTRRRQIGPCACYTARDCRKRTGRRIPEHHGHCLTPADSDRRCSCTGGCWHTWRCLSSRTAGHLTGKIAVSCGIEGAYRIEARTNHH